MVRTTNGIIEIISIKIMDHDCFLHTIIRVGWDS
jgi:hypothetical protein